MAATTTTGIVRPIGRQRGANRKIHAGLKAIRSCSTRGSPRFRQQDQHCDDNPDHRLGRAGHRATACSIVGESVFAKPTTVTNERKAIRNFVHAARIVGGSACISKSAAPTTGNEIVTMAHRLNEDEDCPKNRRGYRHKT